MASLNKATLIGRVGRDPDIRSTPSGKAIASLAIATSESWKDKQTGEKKEKTEWHNCTAFDKLAEIIGKYVKKGSFLYVEGKITTEKYTDKNGIEKFATKILINELKMLGDVATGPSTTKAAPPKSAPSQNGPSAKESSEFNDDIPF